MSSSADAGRLNDFTGSIKFQAYLHALLKRLWIIVLVVIVAGFLGAAQVFRTPTAYRSDVVLQVEQEEQKPINIDEVAKENLQSLEILKTIEQNFRTRSLMLRVIEANKLTTVPGFMPGNPGRASEDDLVGFLLDRSTARLRHGTRLIDVSFEHENKQWARTIADSLVKQQILQNLAQRYSASETASDFLLSEADRLRKKLEKSEQALQDYKEKTASVSLEERQNIVVDELKELNEKVTAAKSERLKLEADLAQIRQAGQNVETLLTIPSVGAQASVADLRQKEVAQEAEIATLAQRYKDKHPRMLQAKSQLDEIRRSLADAVLKSPALVQSAYDAAVGNEKNLEAALAEQEKSALALSQQSIQYNVLL
ncbi:MAG: Wzz/FepE/Etk N-terminal domain-containing protein, partial [Rouxiella badensis]|uniref:GumC family protein n=1 Tax=Rouxiella badensis TaxID=1646377 RepID=UPI003C6B770A